MSRKKVEITLCLQTFGIKKGISDNIISSKAKLYRNRYSNYIEFTKKYDNYGNVIEYKFIRKNPNETFNGTHTFKYKYDKEYNWTSKMRYINGVPDMIIEREIEYYK